MWFMLPRKISNLNLSEPVPRTNTRTQDEYSKASEITIVKELCKMIPYVSNKGCSLLWAAGIGGGDCLSKT